MIPTNHTDLLAGQGTHAGESGKNNEDSYRLAGFQSNPDGELVTLGIIADGIGGHRAGEVASALVVETILQAVAESNGSDYAAILGQAVARAAAAIAEQAQQPSTYNMGSTCVVALVAGRRLYTAYIGDSRLYVLRGQTFRQTSVDHTWVQEAIEAGVLTYDQARQHPARHIVRRHLGRDPQARADFRLRLSDDESRQQAEHNQGLLLAPGDGVLLCSDGLSDLVQSWEMLDAILRHPPQAAVETLIQLARQRGGHDNITILLLRVPET